MTTRSTEPVEQLLAATEAAHGAYEATELAGVYDQAWPRWYATYAVDHGIGTLVGREVMAEELERSLLRAWDAFQAAQPRPTESWAAWTARRLVEELD
jgi:hypothetical protein